MMVEQMDGQRSRETIQVQPAVRIAALHLGLQRPPDMFDLPVPRLKAISDFQPVRIDAGLLRDAAQKTCGNTDDKSRVALFQLPPRRHAGRKNIDISMHAEPAVTLARAGAGDM